MGACGLVYSRANINWEALLMCVRIRGRKVSAELEPIRNGYFLRSHVNEVFGLQPGSILEVDGGTCIVKYLIAGDPGESEVWAILMPVKTRAGEWRSDYSRAN
jgi:hypothetical protein